MSRRVVVSGLGLLSPLGEGPDAHREAWLSGRSYAGPLALPEAEALPFVAAAEVSDFKPGRYVKPRKNLKVMTRAVRLGVAAAHLAMEDAGLSEGDVEPVRFAIYVGAPHAYGESRDLVPALERATEGGELDMQAFGRDGLPLVNPLWLLKGLSNNVLGFSSQRYRAMGPNANFSGQAAGALQALVAGLAAIRAGRADVALCGGYDSLLCLEALTGYGRLGLLSTADRPPETASRPFDRARDGFVPSEGGAFLVLEEASRARARGARILGEVRGGGEGADAFHPAAAQPEGRGLAVAAHAALRSAAASPADLAFVVADAAGTRAGDLAEALALRTLLGEQADAVPVTAPKGAVGQTVAASGALSAAAALLQLEAGLVAPTANLDDPDPACALCHVRGEPRPPRETANPLALVQAAALGGQAAALLLGSWEDD